MTTAAELFIRCMENEGVDKIFGIPGEENLYVMEALRDSSIEFITVRHEQAAAFMADVHGRLTGKAGVCLTTLGPGATNLVTGFTNANMDRSPIVAIAGQGATTRMHKESHQILDLVRLFEPISKYSIEIREPEIIPELVRKAFKDAQAEKPGGSFISFPENIAGENMSIEALPLKVQTPLRPDAPKTKVVQAAQVIDAAKFPLIMAGNGVIRNHASEALVAFSEKLNIPVTQTFMAKGVMPSSHPLSLGSVGMQAHDYVACGFDRADVIICIGYDMVEYPPRLWHQNREKKIIHIDLSYAEVDAHYILEAGVLGDISNSLKRIAAHAKKRHIGKISSLKVIIMNELDQYANDSNYPMKPQKILFDTRQVMGKDDILISDVGAHKMWIARLFRCERPNTCIISNGFAAMGIGVPGAIAAKMVCPHRNVLTITGDAGFMMNSQEIETALRYGIAIVIMVWNDGEYGLIKWHQERRFGHSNNIGFGNPDFVKYAESFGAKGYRVDTAQDLRPTLEKAFSDDTVVVVDVAVDYSENMKLTEKLGHLVCPA